MQRWIVKNILDRMKLNPLPFPPARLKRLWNNYQTQLAIHLSLDKLDLQLHSQALFSLIFLFHAFLSSNNWTMASRVSLFEIHRHMVWNHIWREFEVIHKIHILDKPYNWFFLNKHEMNFIPNKRTSYNELYLINSGISGREREREKFCVMNVKYKEISWRVRRRRRRGGGKK